MLGVLGNEVQTAWKFPRRIWKAPSFPFSPACSVESSPRTGLPAFLVFPQPTERT